MLSRTLSPPPIPISASEILNIAWGYAADFAITQTLNTAHTCRVWSFAYRPFHTTSPTIPAIIHSTITMTTSWAAVLSCYCLAVALCSAGTLAVSANLPPLSIRPFDFDHFAFAKGPAAAPVRGGDTASASATIDPLIAASGGRDDEWAHLRSASGAPMSVLQLLGMSWQAGNAAAGMATASRAADSVDAAKAPSQDTTPSVAAMNGKITTICTVSSIATSSYWEC
jgi:hypothetical protein